MIINILKSLHDRARNDTDKLKIRCTSHPPWGDGKERDIVSQFERYCYLRREEKTREKETDTKARAYIHTYIHTHKRVETIIKKKKSKNEKMRHLVTQFCNAAPAFWLRGPFLSVGLRYSVTSRWILTLLLPSTTISKASFKV